MQTSILPAPTESELEILQILWEQGASTVRQVHALQRNGRDIGYTTTLKTMQIMAEKGLLERDTSQRTHVYFPLVSREQTQQHFLGKMIHGLFKGSASRLVIGALDHKNLSSDDINEIKAYLDQFDKTNKA